jgi:hypothetical protein
MSSKNFARAVISTGRVWRSTIDSARATRPRRTRLLRLKAATIHPV